MEYIFTKISLAITTFLLSLGMLFGVPIEAPVQTDLIAGTTTAIVTKVIDGDTIDISLVGDSDSIRVRYIGIDTPEPYATDIPECGSSEATKRNKELVDGQTVTIIPGIDPYDQHDRLLAYVYVDETFVNETLVKEGYATVMMIKPNTQYQNHFNNLYKNAREEKLGIWSICN